MFPFTSEFSPFSLSKLIELVRYILYLRVRIRVSLNMTRFWNWIIDCFVKQIIMILDDYEKTDHLKKFMFALWTKAVNKNLFFHKWHIILNAHQTVHCPTYYSISSNDTVKEIIFYGKIICSKNFVSMITSVAILKWFIAWIFYTKIKRSKVNTRWIWLEKIND